MCLTDLVDGVAAYLGDGTTAHTSLPKPASNITAATLTSQILRGLDTATSNEDTVADDRLLSDSSSINDSGGSDQQDIPDVHRSSETCERNLLRRTLSAPNDGSVGNSPVRRSLSLHSDATATHSPLLDIKIRRCTKAQVYFLQPLR